MFTFTKKVNCCRAFKGFELHIRSAPVQSDTGFIIRWSIGIFPGICTETGVRQGGSIYPFVWKCWCWEVTLQANPSIGALSIVQDQDRNRNFFGPFRQGSEFYRVLPGRPEKLRLRNWLSLFIGWCSIEGPRRSTRTKRNVTTQSQIRYELHSYILV